MRNLFKLLTAVTALIFGTESATAHPYLLNSNDLINIRTRIAVPNSVSKKAYEGLNTQIVTDLNPHEEPRPKEPYLLVELSLKALVSGDPTLINNAIVSMSMIRSKVNPLNWSPYMRPESQDPTLSGQHIAGQYGWPMAISYDLLYPHMNSSARSANELWLNQLADWYWTNLKNGNNRSTNWYMPGWVSLANIALVMNYENSSGLTKTYYSASKSQMEYVYSKWYGSGGYPILGESYKYYSLGAAELYGYMHFRKTGQHIMKGSNESQLLNYYGHAFQTSQHFPSFGDMYGYNPYMEPFTLAFLGYNANPVELWYWNFVDPTYEKSATNNANLFTVMFHPNITPIHPDVAGVPKGYYYKDLSGLGGFVSLRNNWHATDGITAWFSNKYSSTTHMHYDMNSFELSAFGNTFIIDRPHYSYGVKHAKSTEHSTIIVDNLAMPSVYSKTGGTACVTSSLGTIDGFTSGSGGTVFRGNAQYPYVDTSKIADQLGLANMCLVTKEHIDQNGGPYIKAERIFALVDGGSNPSYFITVDNINKDNASHKYEYRLHTDKDFVFSGDGTINNPIVINGVDANLNIYSLQTESTVFGTSLLGEDGGQFVTRVLSLVENNRLNGHFFTLLYPNKSGMVLPSISSTGDAGKVIVSIQWGNGVDYLVDNRNKVRINENQIETDARLVSLRTDQVGNVTSFMLSHGSFLKYKGVQLALLDTTGSVSSSIDEGAASIDGNDVKEALVFSPHSRFIIRNQEQTELFSRQDGYIAIGDIELSKDQWTILSVNSEASDGGDFDAGNAIDNNSNTIWHTAFDTSAPSHPHEIVIDLGMSHTINGFSYLPRQDGSQNGAVANYQLYVSTNPQNWGSATKIGTIDYSPDKQTFAFTEKTGRYVRFIATSEVNGNKWTSIAELGLTGFAAPTTIAKPPQELRVRNR